MKRLGVFKRGDTFSFLATIKDGSGNLIEDSVAKLASQIRNAADEVIATLIITETATSGTYLFTVAAENTTDWPTPSTLSLDIQYTADGVVTSSETLVFDVVKRITK
jgi:hypothetical protein